MDPVKPIHDIRSQLSQLAKFREIIGNGNLGRLSPPSPGLSGPQQITDRSPYLRASSFRESLSGRTLKFVCP